MKPTPVWTPTDFRALVTELRAMAAEHNATEAPVFDIRTGKRIG